MLRPILILIQGSVIALLLMNVLLAGSTTAATGPVLVEITDEGYSPSDLAIPPETTITWINRGTMPHTVSSTSGDRLDSPVLEPRFAYSYTFHDEGSFSYHDDLYPELTGIVTVAEEAQLTPVPTSEPTATPTSTPSAQEGLTSPVPSTDDPAGAPFVADSEAAGQGPDLKTSDAKPAGVSPSANASAGSVAVDMGNEWFGSSGFQSGVYELTIQAGDTIQWNVTEGIHNVYECGDNWSDLGSGCASAAWHSEQVLTQGGSFQHTFDTAGTIYYLCTIHPQTMRGQILVEAAAQGTPTATPRPTPSPVTTATPSPTTSSEVIPTLTPTSTPEPVVAGEAALPKGGGSPPADGGMPRAPFFFSAAVAFVAGALIFWRWSRMTE